MSTKAETKKLPPVYEWSTCCKSGVTLDEHGQLYCKTCYAACEMTDLLHPAPAEGTMDDCSSGTPRQL